MMRRATTVACIAASLLAAGCGDDGDSGDSGQPPAATTQPGSVGGVGETKPGTTLKVGDTANVKWNSLGRDDTYDVDATVVEIEEAPIADFKDVSLDAEEKQGTPYYVTVKVSNAGKEILVTNGEPGLGFEGVDDRGQEQENVTFIGDFPPCEYVRPKKPIGEGKSYKSCLVFLVPKGGTLAGVRWTGSDEYVLKPVVWK